MLICDLFTEIVVSPPASYLFTSYFFYMEKILQFPYYRVQKLEYPILYNRTIAIFDKHDPDQLLLNDILNAVKAKKELADSLKVEKRDHPLSGLILNQGKMRRHYTVSLWNQIQVYQKANEKAAVKDKKVTAVFSFAKTYFASFLSNRPAIRGQITTQFINDLNADEVMKQYFTDLGLHVLVGKISETHQGMQDTLAERTADISIRTRAETERIKKDLVESLKNLFNAVSVAAEANPSLDYQPLVKELNVELKAIKASLKKIGKTSSEEPTENEETVSEVVV